MFTPILKSLPNEDICLLVKVKNYSKYFMCDCGDASELTIKECQNTEAIFISHTHIDHFINFDTILRHQIGIKRRVIICGPSGIIEQVQSRIKGFLWNLISADAIVYEVREISTDGSITRAELRPAQWNIEYLEPIETLYSNDLFTVDYVQLNHKTATIAYRFKAHDNLKIDITNSGFQGGKWVNDLKNAFENDNNEQDIVIADKTFKAKELYHLLVKKLGETLGFIMDHDASEENHALIKSLFMDCDTVFIESFYKHADKEQAQANFHSYSTASAQVMKDCQVKNAVPVHFSRRYKTDDLQELLAEFKAVYTA